MASNPKTTVVIRCPRDVAEKLRRDARRAGYSRPAYLQIIATRYSDEIVDRENRRLREPAPEVYFCGGVRADGGACSRTVSDPDRRCWQHPKGGR